MTIEEFVIKHNPCNLYVEYNAHKTNYETVKEFFSNNIYIDSEDILDKEDCIKNDTIWNLHVYPATPIGFYSVYASTLEKAINAIDEVLSNNK